MKRWYAFLLMMANAVLVFAVTWSGDRPDETLVVAVMYIVLLTGLALLLLARPYGFVAIVGRACALAILMLVTGFFVVYGFVILMTEYGPVRMSRSETFFVSMFIVVEVVLLRVLRPAAGHASEAAPTGAATVVAFASFFAVFYLGTIVHAVAGDLLLLPRVRADSTMTASIPRVQACAVAYAKRAGEYPSSLAALGPPPAGSGCLDARHASGELGRVRLAYLPAPDSIGRVTRYRVIARIESRLEPSLALGDESGIVRSGYARDSADLMIAHGGLLSLRSVRACAEYARTRYAKQQYPEAPAGLFVERYPSDTEEVLGWRGCLPMNFPAFDVQGRGMANVGQYTPVRDSTGRVVDYTLEIRPRVYGVRGVRSIMTTARGPVYSTLEDRPATDADAVVPPCAYEVDDGKCAPEPGGLPAIVGITVPDTVPIATPFTIVITDARDSASSFPPYQFYVECSRHMFFGRLKKWTYTFSPRQECRIPPDGDSGTTAWVRIWIRDRAGSETAIQRRVTLLTLHVKG